MECLLLAEQLALPGSHSLYLADDGWLYAGGLYQSLQWQPAAGCELLDFNTIEPGVDNAVQLNQVLVINLFDTQLQRSLLLDSNVYDMVRFGDYLLLAAGSKGVALLKPERPEQIRYLQLTSADQAEPGRVIGLELLGSSLLVANDAGGVLLFDLSDLDRPQLLSAGTKLQAKDLALFKDRVVVAQGQAGFSMLDLPGALVTSASVTEQGILGNNVPLQIQFNELMAVESLQQAFTLQNLTTAESISVQLQADDGVNYGEVARAMASIERAGITKLSVITAR